MVASTTLPPPPPKPQYELTIPSQNLFDGISDAVMDKDCQGLEWPPGVRGKGMKGKGQGSKLATPEKPLPLPGVSRVFLL